MNTPIKTDSAVFLYRRFSISEESVFLDYLAFVHIVLTKCTYWSSCTSRLHKVEDMHAEMGLVPNFTLLP